MTLPADSTVAITLDIYLGQTASFAAPPALPVQVDENGTPLATQNMTYNNPAYESSDPTIATVTEINGAQTISPVAVGTATITVSESAGSGTPSTLPPVLSGTVVVTVVDSAPIPAALIPNIGPVTPASA